VAADSVYGVGEVEMALRRAGKGYVLGVTGGHPFWSWGGKPEVAGTAESIAEALPASDWQRLSAGSGTMIGTTDHPSPQGRGRQRPRGGERMYDWAYLELADLDAEEFGGSPGSWTRGLLIRRAIADESLAFFTTWCPAGTGIARLVRVEGARWAIEDGFETAKTELGLDHNETRSPRASPDARTCGDGAGACCAGWHGWHRHVSLVMLAFGMLVAVRRRANGLPPPKSRATEMVRRWCAGQSRRSAG
jgi:SRSO17 transposase